MFALANKTVFLIQLPCSNIRISSQLRIARKHSDNFSFHLWHAACPIPLSSLVFVITNLVEAEDRKKHIYPK